MTKESRKKGIRGRAEMSLIEHALCPLTAKPGVPLVHDASYWYYDQNNHRKKAKAVVEASRGLCPNDEVFLWTLLALSLSQESHTFYATRGFILRTLGMTDTSRGRNVPSGKHYKTLHGALQRLARSHYSSDNIYDPVRGEHREAEFGFLSYTKPTSDDSQRGWHFGIDPMLYYFMEPSKAYFSFDLATVSELDDASRRLFLLLKKIFRRRPSSPTFHVSELACDVLGYARTKPNKKLKERISSSAERLEAIGMVDLSHGLFTGKGRDTKVIFHRGDYLDRDAPGATKPRIQELPIYELWQTIGVDDKGMEYLYRNFTMEMLQEWADITIVAMETKGKSFFGRSPAAFYINNVKAAKKEGRRPPDWWLEYRKQEYRHELGYDQLNRSTDFREPTKKEFENWLRGDGRELFEKTLQELLGGASTKMVSDREAKNAVQRAKSDMWIRFANEWSHEEDSGVPFFLN